MSTPSIEAQHRTHTGTPPAERSPRAGIRCRPPEPAGRLELSLIPAFR